MLEIEGSVEIYCCGRGASQVVYRVHDGNALQINSKLKHNFKTSSQYFNQLYMTLRKRLIFKKLFS